ncbi:MAG: beta-N-acetylhexosaminidase [Akkermansia sp.]|nr:beta-N-acetylhexosaminidase [Akkermansia sp.]
MRRKHVFIAIMMAAVLGGSFPCGAETNPEYVRMAQEWTSPHDLKVEQTAKVALLPFPQQVIWHSGELDEQGREPRLMGDVGTMLQTALEDYQSSRMQGNGILPVTCTLHPDALPKEHAAEGYKLTVGADGVKITAVTEAGLLYGFQTLRQMLATGKGKLPYCDITDWPAFRYRGYMQDCGRNFRSVERLKAELSLAAQLKVNLFHWHMTDYPAWHIECKSYPQLNAPRHRTRDKNDTYTYEQIRDVFAYAAERNITIIPELDMPGHSAYFERAFGFKMHTPQGMKIVGELLDEFCREIPAEICPIVHFGADEVRIPNAAQFVDFVTKKLQSHGRTPMQWASNRDLPVGEHSIEQRWGEGADMVAKSIRSERIKRPAFDSTMGYTNLLDPALLVRRYFFMRPCGSAQGDELKLGTIMCIWPDGKVDDKSLIPAMCTMWPGMMAMAERSWKGGGADGDHLPLEMPAADTTPGRAYALFEQRMQALRDTQFAGESFPVWPESAVSWTVVEPVPARQAAAVREQVLSGKLDNLHTRRAHCANLYFRTRPDTGYLGMFPKARAGQTVWAVTTIHAEQAGPQKFMVGFDAPARSNRRWTGVPRNGEWSQAGTRIWLNGQELKNPRSYRLAGQRRHPGNAWNFEHPLDVEEIWWVQEPVEITLQKGDNTFIIEQPYAGEHHSWGVSLIPVK